MLQGTPSLATNCGAWIWRKSWRWRWNEDAEDGEVTKSKEGTWEEEGTRDKEGTRDGNGNGDGEGTWDEEGTGGGEINRDEDGTRGREKTGVGSVGVCWFEDAPRSEEGTVTAGRSSDSVGSSIGDLQESFDQWECNQEWEECRRSWIKGLPTKLQECFVQWERDQWEWCIRDAGLPTCPRSCEIIVWTSLRMRISPTMIIGAPSMWRKKSNGELPCFQLHRRSRKEMNCRKWRWHPSWLSDKLKTSSRSEVEGCQRKKECVEDCCQSSKVAVWCRGTRDMWREEEEVVHANAEENGPRHYHHCSQEMPGQWTYDVGGSRSWYA